MSIIFLAPSLNLLCDPYGTPKKDSTQETEPKEIPITSDSSVDSTSSASRTTPKDVPNIELPNTFETNDYDSGEDDYDPANCAFSGSFYMKIFDSHFVPIRSRVRRQSNKSTSTSVKRFQRSTNVKPFFKQ